MTRTAAREIAVQLGFAMAADSRDPREVFEDFFGEEHYASLAGEDPLFASRPDEKQLAYIRSLSCGVAERREELDGYIEKYATGWKVSRISKTAAAILRAALYEVLYMDEVPDAAAINEAVELAKGYDDPETVAFLNGVLGGFMRGEKGAPAAETPEPEAASVPAETEETP